MRVWDKFLSERDKRHLSTVKEPPRVGFGSNPALLLIDNYKAGLGEARVPLLESIKKYPLSMGEEAWDAVEKQRPLVDLCRHLRLPIIHTNLNFQEHAPLEFYTALRLSPQRRTQKPVASRLNPQADGSIFDFIPQLKPADDDIVILKTGPSAFHGTPLLSVLHQFHIDTLLVCGESTSGCVRATVVDAATYCFRTIVIEECVYDRHEACHAMALFDMHQKYADVCSIEEVFAWLHDREKRNA
jgi:maleamate amidohydrolase